MSDRNPARPRHLEPPPGPGRHVRARGAVAPAGPVLHGGAAAQGARRRRGATARDRRRGGGRRRRRRDRRHPRVAPVVGLAPPAPHARPRARRTGTPLGDRGRLQHVGPADRARAARPPAGRAGPDLAGAATPQPDRPHLDRRRRSRRVDAGRRARPPDPTTDPYAPACGCGRPHPDRRPRRTRRSSRWHTRYAAWSPGRRARRSPSRRSSCPTPVRARRWCGCRRAACATPTCTTARARINDDFPFLLGHEAAGIVEAVGDDVTERRARRLRGPQLAGGVRRVPGVPARPALVLLRHAQRDAEDDARRRHRALPGARHRRVRGEDARRRGPGHEGRPERRSGGGRAARLRCDGRARRGDVHRRGRPRRHRRGVRLRRRRRRGDRRRAARRRARRSSRSTSTTASSSGRRSSARPTPSNAGKEDAVEAVRALTDGNGADVCIEAVGNPEVMQQAFFARDLAGTLVQVGVPDPSMTIDLPMIEFFGRGGALKPSWYGDCLPSRDFPMLVDLYLQGRLAARQVRERDDRARRGRGRVPQDGAGRGPPLGRGAVSGVASDPRTLRGPAARPEGQSGDGAGRVLDRSWCCERGPARSRRHARHVLDRRRGLRGRQQHLDRRRRRRVPRHRRRARRRRRSSRASPGRRVVAIVCTHGHNDHINAAAELADAVDAPIVIHPDDRMLWDVVYPTRPPDGTIADGERFTAGGVELVALHTPGHSPGGVSLHDAAQRAGLLGRHAVQGRARRDRALVLGPRHDRRVDPHAAAHAAAGHRRAHRPRRRHPDRGGGRRPHRLMDRRATAWRSRRCARRCSDPGAR